MGADDSNDRAARAEGKETGPRRANPSRKASGGALAWHQGGVATLRRRKGYRVFRWSWTGAAGGSFGFFG